MTAKTQQSFTAHALSASLAESQYDDGRCKGNDNMNGNASNEAHAVDHNNMTDEELAKATEEYLTSHLQEDHEEDANRKSSIPEGGFQVPDAVDIEKLLISTRQLVDEQKIALNIIICYCKEL